jgi:hypothetical protein
MKENAAKDWRAEISANWMVTSGQAFYIFDKTVKGVEILHGQKIAGKTDCNRRIKKNGRNEHFN